MNFFRRYFGWLLFSLGLGCVILMNLPIFFPGATFTHDTLYSFSGYAIFTKHLRQFGDLPLWRPYSTFGAPTDWLQITLLSPSNCFFSAIAATGIVEDLARVYKISLVAEQILFVGACCWLARIIFTSRAAAIVFVLSSALSISCWKQVYMNLRWTTGLPWICIFLILAFHRKSRPLLLISGIFVVTSIYGVGYYPVLVYGLFWICTFSALLFQEKQSRERGHWLIRRPDRWDLNGITLSALVAAATTCLILSQIMLVRHGQNPTSPSRDPITGTVDLPTFLTYGGTMDIGQLFAAFSYGNYSLPSHELTLYLGVPMMALAFVGLYSRSYPSQVFKIQALVFAAFCISGLVTAAMYYFPAFNHFRHVAYASVYLRFSLCVLAGFGVQHLLLSLKDRYSVSAKQAALAIAAVVGCLLMFSFKRGNLNSLSDFFFENYGARISIASAIAFLIVILVLKFRPSASSLLPALLAGIPLIGMALVNWQAQRPWVRVDPSMVPLFDAFSAPLVANMQRPSDPLHVGELIAKFKDTGSALYDPVDSALSLEAPFGRRYDVLPTDAACVIRLFRSKDWILKKITLDGLPKVFVAEVPADARDQSRPKGRPIPLLSPSQPSSSLHAFPLLSSPPQTSAFNFNEVQFQVRAAENAGNGDRFLIYADNMHQEWSASVNSHAAPIWKASSMFKAVPIGNDQTTVHFAFGSPLRRFLAWSNFVLASLIFVGQFTLLAYVLLRENRQWSNASACGNSSNAEGLN